MMHKNSITLIDTEDMLVAVSYRDSNAVTFCFTGIGHAMGGIDIQDFEFAKSSQNSTTIFVVDRKRSWGNSIDFELLIDSTRRFTHGKVVNAIGNSMGGFLAILLSRFLHITSCVAFVPQYSVNTTVMPNENRFRRYTDEIRVWKYESLSGCFVSETRYYVFFGSDGGIEDEHRKLIPRTDNVSIFLFFEKDWAHSVAKKLKDAGRLYPTIAACFALRKPQRIVSEDLKGFNVELALTDRG